MDEQTLQELIGRHYRDEWGNCAFCGTSDGYEPESVEWPCDAAVLLHGMGYTLREDPPHVYPPRDPNAPPDFLPTLWRETLWSAIQAKPVFEMLVTGTFDAADTISIPHIRSLEIRA